MKIRKNAWHAKLYLEAYASNRRTWLDGDLGFEADYIMNKSHDQWVMREHTWETIVDHLSCVRADQVREQFLKGRLALCPYFWSVVAAVFIYTPLSFLAKMWAAIGATVNTVVLWTSVSVVAAALIVGAGVMVYEVGGYLIALPAEYAREREAERLRVEAAEAWDAANKAQWAETFRLRQEENARWEREHPAEAAAMKLEAEQKAAADKLEAEQYLARAKVQNEYYEQEQSRRFWASLRAGTLEFGKFVGYLILIIGGIVALLLAAEPAYNIVSFVPYLPLLAIYVVLYQLDKSERGRRINAWIERRHQNMVRAIGSAKRFLADTWELCYAMAKASKEQVCPFLQVEAEAETSEQ